MSSVFKSPSKIRLAGKMPALPKKKGTLIACPEKSEL
jgi:hypothetical protein